MDNFSKLMQIFDKYSSFNADKLNIIENLDMFSRILSERITNSNRFYGACLYIGSDGIDNFKPVLQALRSRISKNMETYIKVDKIQKHRITSRFRQPLDKAIIEKMEFVDERPGLMLPASLKEALYVFHDKIYVFDDEVIITGANLYDDFFQNKRDRYYLIRNKHLADFAIDHIFKKSNRHFTEDSPSNSGVFTKIFHFSHQDEIEVLRTVFSGKYEDVYISTPYMNFPQEYIDILKGHELEIFTVSPECQKFSHHGIVGKVVPNVYAYSISKTLEYLPKCRIKEFCEEGEGYHAKGMWLMNKEYGITILGSSNYNKRSFKRDHESCWLMVSNDPGTLEKWKKEIREMKRICKKKGVKREVDSLSMFVALIVFYLFNSFF